jgi:AbrB family looped-hinge helix DNA binding protein
MSSSTITSKGQITVPKAIRKAFSLEAGTQVVFVPQGNNILIYPVRPGAIERLRETAAAYNGPQGRQAERESAQRHVAEQVLKD